MKTILRHAILAATACGLLGLASPASAQSNGAEHFRDIPVDENLNCVQIAEICGFNLGAELRFEEELDEVPQIDSTGEQNPINTGPISEDLVKFGQFLGTYTGEIAIRETNGGEVVDYFDLTTPVPNQQLDVEFIEALVASEDDNGPSGDVAGLEAIFIKAARTFFLRCGINLTPDVLTGLRPAIPGNKQNPPQISHVSACYGEGSCLTPQDVVTGTICPAFNPGLTAEDFQGDGPDPTDPNFIAQIVKGLAVDDSTINNCGCPPFDAIFCEAGSPLCTQDEFVDVLSQGALSTLLSTGSPGCKSECLLSLCATSSGGTLIKDDCSRAEKRFCRNYCD